MSGTSARESYRSGKRARPSDSQPTRATPPVLFRLPSVAMPVPDAVANAGNMSAVLSATMPVGAASMPAATSAVPVSSTPSAPAQAAATSASTEKASGQRLLNMMIIVLLIAALALIAWISINRPTTGPSMADNQAQSNATLDALGDLKVPDVSTGTVAEAPKSQEKPDKGLNLDEIKPANPADLSLIDLPDSQVDPKTNSESESLLVGIDLSGTESTLNASSPTDPPSTPTAQIHMRAPVPMGNGLTSLVDAGTPPSQLSSATLSSTTTPRVDTVSTPTQPTKIFPANTDTANGSTSSAPSTNSSATSNSNNSSSGGSPSLWDGAQRPAQEGLQLSSKTSANAAPTEVKISKPLSAEINMVATQGTPHDASRSMSNQNVANAPSQGVTVGGGAKEPYTLPASATITASSNLQKNRPDLDPTLLARVAASGAAKSAVTTSGSTSSGSTSSQSVNSYNIPSATNSANQNLYRNTPTGSVANMGSPINSYTNVPGNVPPGTTGNGTQPYVPPTTGYANTMVPNASAQMVSGPNSVPSMTASYTVPPRGVQPGYSTQAGLSNAGYAQPVSNAAYPQQQPAYQQPPQQSFQPQMPGYSQPAYSTNGYGQPNVGYGPATGSAYANPAYPTPSMNMPSANAPGMHAGLNMPAAGYQSGASYPTRNPYPGGQVPSGLIGPAGNATAPSGDIAPVPVMGRGGVGTSTPYGAPQ